MQAEPARGALLAHLSDAHLPLQARVDWYAVLNKRVLSLISWRRKRHLIHRPETLAALVADLLAQAPDHIAVTGDLTNLGLDREYRQARAWLETLGAPERVTVIPGNHDALVSGAWARGAAHWRPFWQGDAPPAPPDIAQAFPTLRRRGPLALIGVSSAIASAPGLAVGEVGAAQLDRLAAVLRQTRAAHLCRVVMIHHPPLDGTVSHRKRLRDAAALRAVLARAGVELVLHGHSHRSHHQRLETRDGIAPVIGVPSASAMHPEPAAYHLYRIAPTPQGWQVTLTARGLGSKWRMETRRCDTLTLVRAHRAA